jgi:Mg-chelatase subunit ChlD
MANERPPAPRLCLWLVLLLLLAAPTAEAGVAIRNLDASSPPTLRFTVVTARPAQRAPRVLENGRPVAGLSAENLGRDTKIVLAVDHSQSMHGRALRDATVAARRFIALGRPGDQFAVVSFASQTTVLSGFGSTGDDAAAGLAAVEVDRLYGTTLYDAVVRSSNLLRSTGTGGRVLVLVTDGQETTSHATLAQAIHVARRSHVAVYPVATQSTAFSPIPLRLLAARTGGTYHGVLSSSMLGSIYAAISSELRRTWQLQNVTSAQPRDTVRIRVTVQGRGAANRSITMPGHATVERSHTPLALYGPPLVLMLALEAIVLVPATKSTIAGLKHGNTDLY